MSQTASVAVSVPVSGLEREVVILDVSGPSRIFVDVKARFLVRMSGLSADPARVGFEWKLVDADTGTDVDFGYNADPPLGDPQYFRRRHGYFFVHVTSASLGARGMAALARRSRRLRLIVQVAADLRRDDFVAPVQRPLTLTTFRLVPFPDTDTVPIYTVRQFRLDVPDLPDAGFYEEPLPRIRRVRWTAISGSGDEARALDGPTHEVDASAGTGLYPDLGWGAPDWTDGTHGIRAAFNRLGPYTVRCDVEFHDAPALAGLTHTLEAVQHAVLPDMAIVRRGDLPALVGTETVLSVESDPKLCADLPPYPLDEANLGVDYVWSQISLDGRSIADLRGLPDSAWSTIAYHQGTHRDPAPRSITLKKWTAPGRYAIRCLVTLWQYPSPGPLRTTLFHVVNVVTREPPSRLAYRLAESQTVRLELLVDTYLTRTRQLAQRYPASPLTALTDRVWSRLSRRVPTMFATDDDTALSWKRVEAEPLPGIFIPDRDPRPYPMRFYWQSPARDRGPHTIVLFDAVGEELRTNLGVTTERVYRAFGRSLPELFRESFMPVQNGADGDYPPGQLLALGETWRITGEAREFRQAVDRAVTAAWALGWLMSLAPEPSVTKVVGIVTVVGTGLYFALRSGTKLAAEAQDESLDFGEAETWFDVMNVVSGLVGAAELGVQARWGFQVLREGDAAWRILLPGENMVPTPLSRTLAAVNTGSDLGQIMLVGVDTMATLDAIRHDTSLSPAEQRQRIHRVLLDTLWQAGLMLVALAPALRHRKLWRREFWHSNFTEVEAGHRQWLAELERAGIGRPTVIIVDDVRLRAVDLWASARDAGITEAMSNRWMRHLGEEAHVAEVFGREPGRYIYVKIGGAGMPDMVFVDLTPDGGGPPRAGIVECKGSADSKPYAVSELEATRTGHDPALEASRDYLELPVTDDRPEQVGAAVDRVLQARIDAAPPEERGRLELLREHYRRARARRLPNGDIDPRAFLVHYTFAGPAPRMRVGQLRALLRRVPHAELFFYRTRANLAIHPELFQKHLQRGYYQVLRITNAALARQAYIAWSGPEDDDTRLDATRIAALERVERLVVEALDEEFASVENVQAILEAMGHLDRPLEWALLEQIITQVYDSVAP